MQAMRTDDLTQARPAAAIVSAEVFQFTVDARSDVLVFLALLIQVFELKINVIRDPT
jgi:hypothetical protein